MDKSHMDKSHTKEVVEIDDLYVFECPHCNLIIQVKTSEVNCKIFRHAVYKNNMTQINPHTTKDICDNLLKTGIIYGCTKPFKFIYGPPHYVEICDYI